ncbi:hypothetical protein AGMMS4956_19320 [Bacteroidia bacterium]|nr:hypothetical protein AGMMS4956_19320 [Bacteroidia bacterium]
MITNEVKQRIVSAIADRRKNYGSDAKMSVALGINSAQYSRVKNGDYDSVLSDAKWISIARILDVQLSDAPEWVTAKTTVYNYIYAQMDACQNNNLSVMLCDMTDIGKTYTARCYVKEHVNAVYIDCSQVKTRQKLIRAIAKEFGLGYTGRYDDVYADLVFYLRSIPQPFIILDEFGDLKYNAFLEVKAIWNATEGACSWYGMGADGLRDKLMRNLEYKKVGYAEILSRFGIHDERVKTLQQRFQKITPDGKDALEDFVRKQISQVAIANGVDDVQRIYAKTGGSLRRLRTEVMKLRISNSE